MISEKDAMFNLGCMRRACTADLYNIKSLLTDECTTIFGPVNIEAMLKFNYLPLCQMDIRDDLIGFLALDIYPVNSAIPQHGWVPWIHNLYDLTQVTSRNTHFVHMICWDKIYSQVFLRAVLVSVFVSDPYLSYIIFVMPQNSPPSVLKDDKSFSDILIRVSQKGKVGCSNLEFLYVAERKNFCSKLNVRRAIEEDNDDLVAIIQQQSEDLQKLYGNYYISEIIANPTANDRVVLVGEQKGVPVGVMILNTQINYQKLNECFDLKPFQGLVKHLSQNSTEVQASTINQFFDSKNRQEVKDDPSEESFSSNDRNIKIIYDKNSRHESKKNDFLLRLKSREIDFGIEEVIKIDETDSDTSFESCDSSDFDIINVDDNTLMNVNSFLENISRIAENRYGKPNRKSNISSLTIDKFKMDNAEAPTPISFDSTMNFSSGLLLERNAYIIEVFAMDENCDERLGFDILEASFEVFPEFEYCIMGIPSNRSTFPLLDHFVFVPLEPSEDFDQCLYIAHRNSIRGELLVRDADITDLPEVLDLIKNLPGAKIVSKMFHETMESENDNKIGFVILSENKVIGLALLEDTKNYDYIRENYEACGDVWPPLHGYHSSTRLHRLILAPQFQQHSRFFFREILRLSLNFEIFWKFNLRNNLLTTNLSRNTMSAMSEFVPLVPKTNMDYNMSHFEEYSKFPKPIQMESYSSILYINHTLCSYPKIDINTRIVVVGASRTSYGFLDALLFGPSSTYLRFNNLTLVSAHGEPYVVQCEPAAKYMIVHYDQVRTEYFEAAPIVLYLNFVLSIMVMIRRKEKYIVTNTKIKLPYDILFLFCGEQYQHPDYLKGIMGDRDPNDKTCQYTTESLLENKEDEKLCVVEQPFNLFIINDIYEAHLALSRLRELIENDSKYIIVYGATINAYTCITGLIEFGISGQNIAFIEPFPFQDDEKHQVTFFNNEYVDHCVTQKIKELNIHMHTNYYFDSWNLNPETNLITSVTFIENHRTLKLNCVALFFYGKKDVNVNTFLALNDCGLVYNERLIINSDFQTNDPNIFAAGPLTKYSQRYQNSSRWSHKYFSSVEIGFKLGNMVLHNINPFVNKCIFKNEEKYLFSDTTDKYNRVKNLKNVTKSNSSVFSVVSLKSVFRHCKSSIDILDTRKTDDYPYCPSCPLIEHCFLPGYEYLNVTSPGKSVPLELSLTREDFGLVLETNTNGYFRIHLDNNAKVKTITCLSLNNFDKNNIICLWGKHEQLLNRLITRFSVRQEINDFYEYFQQPWAYIIYHPKFDSLISDLQDMILEKLEGTYVPVSFKDVAKYLGNYRDAEMLDIGRKQSRLEDFRNLIVDEIMNFIENYQRELPMYALSGHYSKM